MAYNIDTSRQPPINLQFPSPVSSVEDVAAFSLAGPTGAQETIWSRDFYDVTTEIDGDTVSVFLDAGSMYYDVLVEVEAESGDVESRLVLNSEFPPAVARLSSHVYSRLGPDDGRPIDFLLSVPEYEFLEIETGSCEWVDDDTTPETTPLSHGFSFDQAFVEAPNPLDSRDFVVSASVGAPDASFEIVQPPTTILELKDGTIRSDFFEGLFHLEDATTFSFSVLDGVAKVATHRELTQLPITDVSIDTDADHVNIRGIDGLIRDLAIAEGGNVEAWVKHLATMYEPPAPDGSRILYNGPVFETRVAVDDDSPVALTPHGEEVRTEGSEIRLLGLSGFEIWTENGHDTPVVDLEAAPSTLYSLSADGTLLANSYEGGGDDSLVFGTSGFKEPTGVAATKRLVCVFGDGGIEAVHPETGDQLWSNDSFLTNVTTVVPIPDDAEGHLGVGLSNGQAFVLDADGNELSTFLFEHGVLSASYLLDTGLVFLLENGDLAIEPGNLLAAGTNLVQLHPGHTTGSLYGLNDEGSVTTGYPPVEVPDASGSFFDIGPDFLA